MTDLLICIAYSLVCFVLFQMYKDIKNSLKGE
jgi:hypothetical protein